MYDWALKILVGIVIILVLLYGDIDVTGKKPIDQNEINGRVQGIKYLAVIILALVGVGGLLYGLWNGAAWLIAQFVGTVQSYR